MMSLFKDFYVKVGRSPLYWVPLLVFSIVGYSFSIYNRTIHWDDFLKDVYNEIMLSNRWGMVLWGKLTGVMDLVPFVDRFLTLAFLVIASVLISILFYYLNQKKGEILSYTVLSSMMLTYPLINEIYEFTGADLQFTGNLALMILAFIYLTLNIEKPTSRTMAVACLLMILPASSYEVALFSYLTLLCAVILYKYNILSCTKISMKRWLWENVYYLLPLVAAVIIRFIVAFLLREIYDLPFYAGGSTGISYENTTITYILGSNGYRYIFAGLVYFPITVFVIALVVFAIYLIYLYIVERKIQVIGLGMLLVISLFSLSIIQGCCMQYRTAQSLTVFVAFVAFMITRLEVKGRYKFLPHVLLLFLCWHQSVFLNRSLALNNMRSNNEAASIRYVGCRLISEFDTKKPIVLLTNEDYYGGYLGPWITKRAYADDNTWNGRLFNSLTKKYLPEKYHHYKYYNSNIINAIGLGGTQRNTFAYYGFNLNIQDFSSVLSSIKDDKKRMLVENFYNKANEVIPPLGIQDIGECIFVNFDIK